MTSQMQRGPRGYVVVDKELFVFRYHYIKVIEIVRTML